MHLIIDSNVGEQRVIAKNFVSIKVVNIKRIISNSHNSRSLEYLNACQLQ